MQFRYKIIIYSVITLLLVFGVTTIFLVLGVNKNCKYVVDLELCTQQFIQENYWIVFGMSAGVVFSFIDIPIMIIINKKRKQTT